MQGCPLTVRPSRISRSSSRARIHVCGVAPIYVTLRLDDTPGKLLSYGQGRIDPDTGSLVTYTAVAFP